MRRSNDIRSFTTHTFFCLKCGKPNVIPRKKCKQKEKGHRKTMYCFNCRVLINHYETRNWAEEQDFKERFAAGEFIEEAEASIEYLKKERGLDVQ